MYLKEPLQVGQLQLRNRLVLPPMATRRAVNGAPGAGLAEYYRQRARGTALIIVEHASIMPQGRAYPEQFSMANEAVIPAFQTLTAAIHSEGAKAIAQLSHAGAKARDTGLPLVGPSAVSFQGGEMPKALALEEIQAVVEAFAAAAVRAKQAGFDGVEIHSAHGYLLNQFYSPLMNCREDGYSAQTMEGRTRLHKEVLRAVRKAVGPEYTVALRFGACDFLEGGSEARDIPQAVQAFEAAGADLVDVSGGMMGYIRPGHTEPGYLKDLGLAAKTAARVPVLLTGGVCTAQVAEALLQEGACDLVGVGRAMAKDAGWAVKALES